MPNILKLATKDMAWLHRQVWVPPFHCLHSSQFIHTDSPFSPFGSLGCLSIELATLHNFLFPLFVRFLCQPIAEPVGLKAPFLSSRAACRGEIWLTIPRLLSSSAISLPVHWLMGRPADPGASQAKAAI